MAVYESRIGEIGLLLEDPNIQMWVPARYETHSRIIFRYLQDGYTALKKLFGDHDMSVKFSIEHYPEGSPYATGGTGPLGGIAYSYSNLVDNSPEWNQYGIPHMMGYYEEMAHNFRYDLGPGFGFYEALGMMIGSEITLNVAWNPYVQQLVEDAYKSFAETTAYYLEHNTGEPGVTENIYLTRILAHVFKTEVIDPYGWKALTETFRTIQQDYPLRLYDTSHSWGGFLGFLNNVTGKDMHPVFGDYGLPVLEWTGEPGFESGGFKLQNSSDRCQFRIKIIDREGTQPSDVKAHLYHYISAPAGVSYPMYFVGGNASLGWIYEAYLQLSDASGWTYAFSAKDGIHPVFQAVGKPTEKHPIIKKKPTLLTLGIASDYASTGNSITLRGELREKDYSSVMVWQIGTADGSSAGFDGDPHDDLPTIVFNVNESCARFPSGLGTDIGPQRSEVVIGFDSSEIEEAIINIVWNPGGSESVDQFSVSLDGELLGTSQALKGSDHPYEWQTEKFMKSHVPSGNHNITLLHLQGDGLEFDFLCFDTGSRIYIGDQVVHLEYYDSGEWTEIGTSSTLSNGTYTFIWQSPLPGTHVVRARYPDSTTYLESISATTTIVVSFIAITLYGSASSGWGLTSDNITSPGPTINVTKGQLVNLTLVSVDGLPHKFFVDYNDDGFQSSGEPVSPEFSGTINYQFNPTMAGTFTYYCVFYPVIMQGTLIVNAQVHDVAVANVAPEKTVVGQGYLTRINVTVVNIGNIDETFNVTACCLGAGTGVLPMPINTTIDSQALIPALAPAEVRVLAYIWNTTGVFYDNYTVSAVADTVANELNTADNYWTCSIPVHVGVPGDISGPTQGVYDGKCDMRDVSYLIIRFNSKPNSTNWNPNADINNDATVNMRDISIAILNFNKHE